MTSEYFVILCLVWGPGGLGYKDSYLKPSNPILNNNADLEIDTIIANHIRNWLLCHLLTGWSLLVDVYGLCLHSMVVHSILMILYCQAPIFWVGALRRKYIPPTGADINPQLHH